MVWNLVYFTGWRELFLFLICPLVCFSTRLQGDVVTDEFVNAVAQIESSGGQFIVGDSGLANGWWQMHEPAWKDVSVYRQRKGLPVWTYAHAHEPAVARQYARDYLTMLEAQLRAAIRSDPTRELIYAAYNMGMGRLRSIGFQIEKAPRATQAACARVASLVIKFEQKAAIATLPVKQG